MAEAPQTPAPTPTPAQTPAPPVIDELVLRPTFVELHSAGRVVQQLDYMSPSSDAIARFTELFGREPERKSYEGGNHYPDGEDFTWGNLTLRVENLTFDWGTVERSLAHPEFILYFDGPAEGTVGLRSANGTRAGEEWESVSTVSPADGFMTCIGEPVERERADTPDYYGGAAVVATKTTDIESVFWLKAPELEAGGCA